MRTINNMFLSKLLSNSRLISQYNHNIINLKINILFRLEFECFNKGGVVAEIVVCSLVTMFF